MVDQVEITCPHCGSNNCIETQKYEKEIIKCVMCGRTVCEINQGGDQNEE